MVLRLENKKGVNPVRLVVIAEMTIFYIADHNSYQELQLVWQCKIDSSGKGRYFSRILTESHYSSKSIMPNLMLPSRGLVTVH